MKFVLTIISCLVAISHQRSHYNYNLPLTRQYIHPFLDVLPPSYWGNYALQPRYAPGMNYALQPMDVRHDNFPVGNIQGRAPLRSNAAIGEVLENRSLGLKLFPALFAFDALNALATTQTSIVFFTVTSTTATVAVVQSCIAVGQFVANANLIACARRRRDISLIEEAPRNGQSIMATEVIPLATTLVPEARKHGEKPEILSSQQANSFQDEQLLRSMGIAERYRRNFSLTVTLTSTVTSYAFSTTTVKKNYNVAPAVMLLCVPPGYTVC